jgi:glycosyltransferase involved in cell wall biosynthesis
MRELEFSVLISLYNNEVEENLEAALESLVNQILQPNEIVLVLDGPIRSSLLKIVKKYQLKFKSFQLLKLDQNVGLGKALNYGLGFCRYEYVARMDTDDICYPERFKMQIAKLNTNKNISVLGAAMQEFNAVPNDLGRFKILPSQYDKLKKFAIYRNPLNHPTVIFRKQDILFVGSYLDMPLFEDYYLWVRVLSSNFVIENLQESLLHFRIGNDMVKRRHGFQYVKKEIRFLEAIKELRFISSKQMYTLIIMKTPLRLMPIKIFKLVYKLFLR